LSYMNDIFKSSTHFLLYCASFLWFTGAFYVIGFDPLTSNIHCTSLYPLCDVTVQFLNGIF
jgi:hypothetical protein